ncbi:MAG: hypothetical protein IT431_14525 [Phycisphaerales bacterium]|nr:hypothetical protein [Phycisphaerales bacterium]
MRKSSRGVLVLGWLSVCLAAGVSAQPVLSDVVVARPSVGLTALLPEGATRSSFQMAGRGVDKITFPDMAAIVNLTEVSLTEAKTLPEVADSIVRELLSSVSALDVDPNKPLENTPGIGNAKGRLLSREMREINGWPAEVFYLQLASVGGGEDAAYGYAVFMPTGNTVARFELQTTAGDLARAKPYFEAMVNSTRIEDPDLAAAQRALGVESGVAFFRSLTPEDVEAVIKRMGDDWHAERFYQPSETGSDRDAVELGYRLTRYAVGKLEDLKEPSERRGSSPEDRQKGYLVFQKARILNGDQMIDVDAGYFVTPDRSQESWTIRQAVRSVKAPKAPATGVVVETGVRNRSDLTISRVAGGGPVQTIRPAIEGSGYISRAEVLLLPYLLMHKDAPGEYRFYGFNQSFDRVAMREDAVEAPTAERNNWRYTSRASDSSPAQVATFDSKMALVRAERADEQVWEPMSLRTLLDLWKQKGLPVN